jgi:hypothetical protein
MTNFQPRTDRYGTVVAELLAESRLPELGPGQPVSAVRHQLESLTDQPLFEHRVVGDPQMADCCRSGLWLWFDFLEESHTFSQKIPSSSGSFWHGIMHRRETDYGNAKYWFRRVGSHPIYATLSAVTPAMVEPHGLAPRDVLGNGSAWDAARFVDLCEKAHGTSSPLEQACRELAQVEWLLLFDYCYTAACD